MSDIPEDVKPVVALNEGAHLDGYYQQGAVVGDEFDAGATEEEA
jgi:hypothetical protein